MTEKELFKMLRAKVEIINSLQTEIIETNKGLIGLTIELEERIEERDIALEAVRKSQKDLKIIYDTAGDMLFQIGVESDKSFKFLSVNQTFLNASGLTEEQIIGKRIEELVPEESQSLVLSKYKEAIRRKEVVRWEDNLLYSSGKRVGEVSIAPAFNEEGICTHLIGTVHDITERKQAADEIKKKHDEIAVANIEIKKAYEQEAALREQLVNAERLASLGKMAAKIAHEINNPLTVIMGQAEIQLSMTKDPSMKSSLKQIVDKSTEVAELTRRYMNLGKPHDIKMTSILLSEVLRKTVSSLSSLGILKHVKIKESYVKNEPHILGDESMLEQVFRNLIINAIHASSEVPSSEISVGTNVKKNKKAVTAYVSDKGVGIQKENIEKIFEHYYTTKEESTGTGLGLPISKEITEVIHGGEISIESTPGKGTVFNVTIPIDKYALKRRRILIVDDEAYITDTFGEYLSSKGFLIRKAQNGKDALKIYSEFEPDLILSDFNMPEMDGINLFKAVRKLKSDQLFVMITGAFLMPDDLKMLSDNKIRQIIKPADLEKELLKTVREQIEMSSK